MSQTLLIGGTGFLGPIFLKKDPSIIAAGRSPLPSYLSNKNIYLPDLDSLHLLDSVDFDRVIFLVGSSDHHILNSHPTLAIEKNVIPLQKILSYLRTRKIKKFVAFTTMLQYDSQKMRLPVDENQPINNRVNNYVFSKCLAEQVTEYHAEHVPYINIRISNVYGPTHLRRPDIVPTLMWKVIERQEATVWNKSPKRDFIFAEDAAEAVLSLMHTDYVGPVNVGSGISSSVKEVTDIISKISHQEIGEEGIKVWGHMEFCQDISLLQKLTGWKPAHSLQIGLEVTYQEMKKMYHQMNPSFN
jgi:nucleoside-diphosphate-sugar epimerase